MSSSFHKEIHCPSCGKMQPQLMWTSITAPEEPKACEQIMSETLFDFKCRDCGYTSVFYYPCLYHDPVRGFMLYLNPAANAQMLHPEIPAPLIGLRKRLVANQHELKEKKLIFEQNFDDRAVELVKFAADNMIRKKTGAQKPTVYFLRGNGEGLTFAYFLEKGGEQQEETLKIDFYRQALDMLRTLKVEESENFEKVDRQTAIRILQEIRAKQ